MQRHFAALFASLLLLCAAPAAVFAGGGIDAGAPDAGAPDGGGLPDAAVAVPDSGPDSGFFPPALDDGDDCNCASSSGTPGPGAAVLALGVALYFRRRR